MPRKPPVVTKRLIGRHVPDRPKPVAEGLKGLVDLTLDSSRDWTSVAARAISLRMAGLTQVEIAEALSVTVQTVRGWLIKARKNAELLDVVPLLDHVALPQAVDNLIEGLEAGNEKYTLATLQGRGAFSAHSKQESHATSLALEITVEMPVNPRSIADSIEGQVVGLPRVVRDDDG